MELKKEEYFLSLYDLEQMNGGSKVELITKDNRLIVLSLGRDEEEE